MKSLCSLCSRPRKKLPTGLVVAGVDNNIPLHFQSVGKCVNLEERAVLVELSSGQCPNLKITLNFINQRATSQTMEDDDVLVNGNKVADDHQRTVKNLLTATGRADI